MVDKLTPGQYADLQPTELGYEVVSREVQLYGNVSDLVTVATNALPVLDSRLEPEEVEPFIAKLQEGEPIYPSSGHFSLNLLRGEQDDDGTQRIGELRIKIANGPNALMSLIRKALEASVEPINTPGKAG